MKNILLLLFVIFNFSHLYSQEKTQEEKDQELFNLIYEHGYKFDTNDIYPSFNLYDINGNIIVRDSINTKPCLIYYFTRGCSPCSLEMPMLNDFFIKYGNKIDFIAFTPIPKEEIDYYYPENKAPKFTTISVERSYFGKSGFPILFILNQENLIKLKKGGGAGNKKSLEVHYKILTEYLTNFLSHEKN